MLLESRGRVRRRQDQVQPLEQQVRDHNRGRAVPPPQPVVYQKRRPARVTGLCLVGPCLRPQGIQRRARADEGQRHHDQIEPRIVLPRRRVEEAVLELDAGGQGGVPLQAVRRGPQVAGVRVDQRKLAAGQQLGEQERAAREQAAADDGDAPRPAARGLQARQQRGQRGAVAGQHEALDRPRPQRQLLQARQQPGAQAHARLGGGDDRSSQRSTGGQRLTVASAGRPGRSAGRRLQCSRGRLWCSRW